MFNPDEIKPIKDPVVSSTDDINKTKPSGLPKTTKNFEKIYTQKDPTPQADDALADLPEKTSPFKPVVKKPVSPPDSLVKENSLIKGKMNAPTPISKPISTGFVSASPASIPIATRSRKNDIFFIPSDEVTEVADNTDTSTIPTVPDEIAPEEEVATLDQGAILKSTLLKKPRLPGLNATPLDTDATVLAPKISEVKAKNSNLQNQESSDLSYLNTGAPPSFLVLGAQAALHSSKDSSMASQGSMQDIIKNVVDTIKIIQSQGKQEIVVTLKFPPILEGSNLTLTSLEGNKNFHVAFAVTTPEAKEFMNLQLSRDSLTLALEQKGYNVVIAPTVLIGDINIATQTDDRQFAQGEGGQPQQQQPESEEEAT